MTLLEIIKKLTTKEKCLKYIEKIRWPEGVICPRCGEHRVSIINTRDRFECYKCKYQFNAIAGTILSKTYIPLSKWILAIYLYCSHSGQIKPAELMRVLNLPYKTSWHLLNKLKKNSRNFDFKQLAGLI